MSRSRKIIVVALSLLVAGGVVALVRSLFRAARPVTLKGAVIVRNEDVNKQVPIPDARVTVLGDLATGEVWSNSQGLFELTLRKQVKAGQPVILQFRHWQYQPLDVTILAGDRLNVARMLPMPETHPALDNVPRITVSSIAIRYSTKTATLLNVGSLVKTFRVVNTGNIPCNSHYPCSPDGRWKATAGSASLNAPAGDIFSNARVSCIAGPCPFTKIRSDGFSQGGPTISVTILNWSDTTTFLFEAEVFDSRISDSLRFSYPVIFGQTLHFTVPANAEGVCIDADLNRDSIVFPLGPEPLLSWASCTVSVSAEDAAVYQCELKPGYTFAK